MEGAAARLAGDQPIDSLDFLNPGGQPAVPRIKGKSIAFQKRSRGILSNSSRHKIPQLTTQKHHGAISTSLDIPHAK